MIDAAGRQPGGAGPQNGFEALLLEWRERFVGVVENPLELLTDVSLDALAALYLKGVEGAQGQMGLGLPQPNCHVASLFQLDFDQLFEKRHIDSLVGMLPSCHPDTEHQLDWSVFAHRLDTLMDLVDFVVEVDGAPPRTLSTGPRRPRSIEVFLPEACELRHRRDTQKDIHSK